MTGEGDDDEQMQDDEDVTMKSPEQEPQPEEENDDQASKKDDINDERRDFRKQDEVDEFLNEEREQADENDDEETEGGEINIEEYEAGEAHDAVVEYPAWLKRIEFGSKVLPIEPCTIGDAQPELIKILLLQIGLHILRGSTESSNGTFVETVRLHGNTSNRTRSSEWIWIRRCPTSVRMKKANSSNQLHNR